MVFRGRGKEGTEKGNFVSTTNPDNINSISKNSNTINNDDSSVILLSSGITVKVDTKKSSLNSETNDYYDCSSSSSSNSCTKPVGPGRGTGLIEKVNNVWGSTAGAGSDFFHTYRKHREVEMERLKKLDEEFDEQRESREFQIR